MKKAENNLWEPLNKVGKQIRIPANEVTTLRQTAQKILKDFGEELLPSTKKALMKLTPKESTTFSQLKEARTALRELKTGLKTRVKSGQTTREAKAALDGLYSSMTDTMGKAAAGHSVKTAQAFAKANEFTKNFNQLLDKGGKELREAVKDQGAVVKWLNSLLGDKKSGAIGAQRQMGLIQGTPQRQAQAKILADAAADSMEKGAFNVTAFFNKIKNNPRLEGALGDNYKMLKSLQQVIDDAFNHGAMSRETAVATKFSPAYYLGGKVFSKLTSPETKSLRKQLVKYSLIDKNQAMKYYLGNRIAQQFIKARGVVSSQPDGGVVIDFKDGDDE